MKKLLQNSFIVLVLSTISVPVVLTIIDVEWIENCEKRELNKLPEFSFNEEYITDFENYFNDNFGLRNLFVNWGSTIKVNLFKSSLHPQETKYGKSDWFFYTNKGDFIFDSYSNQNLLSETSLETLVKKWEIQKDTLAKKGIKYMRVFWPNKSTIYPENMPFSMKIQVKDTISKVDQILNYLKQTNSSVNLIDVRETLINEKKNNKLYNKFDTHWNSLGAFIAYQDFFNKSYNYLEVKPLNKDDYTIKDTIINKGDLLNMLGICESESFTETRPIFTLKKDTSHIQSFEGEYKNSVIYKNENCGNKLKALVFRDSFTDALIPFFTMHFYETHFVWFGYQNHAVNKINPDIVIVSTVERYI